jgi:hypothetical protein
MNELLQLKTSLEQLLGVIAAYECTFGMLIFGMLIFGMLIFGMLIFGMLILN